MQWSVERANEMLMKHAVGLAVVLWYSLHNYSSHCCVVQQKIEVVSLKQAFPGPEVWQALFTILTGSGNIWRRMVAGSRSKRHSVTRGDPTSFTANFCNHREKWH